MATERGPTNVPRDAGLADRGVRRPRFGPLVVTAAVHDHELAVRSPACRASFPVDRNRLG